VNYRRRKQAEGLFHNNSLLHTVAPAFNLWGMFLLLLK